MGEGKGERGSRVGQGDGIEKENREFEEEELDWIWLLGCEKVGRGHGLERTRICFALVLL